MLLSKRANPELKPVSLMRLTQIDDVDELLKDFSRDDILIEAKYDGWKLQVIKTNNEVHIYSRKGEEKTKNFPELVKSLDFLPNETMVEGELVYEENGKQDEGTVTSLAGSTPEHAIEKNKKLSGSLKIYLYDILWLKGKNVSKEDFDKRRKYLKQVVKENKNIQISESYPFSKWQEVMNKAVKAGGEGIVLKLKNKPYEYKVKGQNEPKPKGVMYKYKGGIGKSDSDDYVVYDYEISDKGKLKAFFGQYYKGKLYYISEISNFSEENENKIKQKLKKGKFVLEIGFQERVPGGLRHQKFVRFRDDKKPKDATMNEFHTKHLDNFKVISKADDEDDEIKSTYEDDNGNEYNVETLFGLTNNNPVKEVSVDELKYFLFEKQEGGYSTKDVIDNPEEYEDDTIRINNADLNYPVFIYKNELVDGYHRLARAFLEKKPIIKVKYLTDEQMEKAKINKKSNFNISKRALFESLTPNELLLKLSPEPEIIPNEVKSVKPVNGLNFNPDIAFQIISTLESGDRSWASGDSGNSFGLTQVHGPYFLKWLSRNPNIEAQTGLKPEQLSSFSDIWKDYLSKIRKEEIFKDVPVDQEAIKVFIKNNPNKVIKRREGVTVKINPGQYPGLVKLIDGKYVGKELDINLLINKYGFDATSENISKLQKVLDTFITDLVLKSSIAGLLSEQSSPEVSRTFFNTFSSKNVKQNKNVKQLSDWVSKSDFMAKANLLTSSVISSGYNPNAPGAFNMYQLMAIANASGVYRVQLFLKNKKLFTSGNLHYLQRANPLIQKTTGIYSTITDGVGGFPKEKLSWLSKRANYTPQEYSGQAGAITNSIIQWLNHQVDLDDITQFGVKYIGKSEDQKIVFVTMSQKDIDNVKEMIPNQLNGYTVVLQHSLTDLPEKPKQEEKKKIDIEEFREDEPTQVDPFRGTKGLYLKQLLEEYEWYLDHLEDVRDDLEQRYNRKFDEEQTKEVIYNTLKQKYKNIVASIKNVLKKCASYIESGTLYFPSQHAEDIKSGKRKYSIRPGDINVKPDEHVKCKTYSGADIVDVKILSKKVMSIPRIEKGYGKNMAKSLERRFGPDKRFVIIEFEPLDINFSDDGNDEEKMSEVLIDKDKKLTRGQIKKHYMKSDIRKKIMARIKDKPILIYIGIGKNEKILKRNHNNKEIIITNDDPNKSEQPNNYFYWVNRRLLSIHQVFGTKTDLGFVDLDIHGSFPLEKAKKYAKELSSKLKSKYGVTSKTYQSGGTGLHVEFNLESEVSIDKLRGELKELLDELNKDWDDVTTGIVKGSGMRSDVSTLHNKGSIRVPGSFGESNGNIKNSFGDQDSDENNYLNAPIWQNKYNYDPDIPFPDTNLVQNPPPQGNAPTQHIYVADLNIKLVKEAVYREDPNLEKEYIWFWDPQKEELFYHLNFEKGKETKEFVHLQFAENIGSEIDVYGKNVFRGYIYFFKGENNGEVVVYNPDIDKMPHELKKKLFNLSKDEDIKEKTKLKENKDIWKEEEKQRQLEKHMEKRKWMGFNESDPEFIKSLDLKFASLHKKKLLIMVAPKDFNETEYFIPRKVFVEKFGFMVDVVSLNDTAKGSQGTVINVDKNLDIKINKYDALFVCGGKGMISFSKNQNAQQLLKDFIENEKPVGLICHGPLLAAEANIINGIEITGWPDIIGKIKRAKGIWTGMPIERAGWIFTAIGPNEAEDLAIILSNYLLGNKTFISPKDELTSKQAQEKLEAIWKFGEEQDDEANKFLKEHPEFIEEEPEEIETEEERMEKALAPKEEIEEENEEEEIEKKNKKILEEQRKKNEPLGFKQVVKTAPPTIEETTESLPEELKDYSDIFNFDKQKWEDIISQEYEIREEDEDENEGNISLFGQKLEPPKDSSGKVLDRWFEPDEIQYPKMSSEAKILFTLDNMKDGPSLTKLFQNPETWKVLEKNPKLVQDWVLPAIIMGIGKRWFDNNSIQIKMGAREGSVGKTPFGLFDEGDIELLSRGVSISDLPSTRVYISQINKIITELTNKYFSYGFKIDPSRNNSLPIGGYLYKSLSRKMSQELANSKGFKEIRTPVCSYCKSRKQKRQSSEVVYGEMRLVGTKPNRWVCEECSRNFEENDKLIPGLKLEQQKKQKMLIEKQNILNKTTEPEERKKIEEEMVTLANNIKHSRDELENLNNIQYSLQTSIEGTPYWHTWCPNVSCPGNRVPLTAIDKKNLFWKTNEGKIAADILHKRFGISVLPVQNAEETNINILPQRIPPDELLDIPFRCPHDYFEFTLRSARGKGLNNKGGYFWEPWQHMKWEPMGIKESAPLEENFGIEYDQEKIQKMQMARDTSFYLSGLATKLFGNQHIDAIKQYNEWFIKQVEKYKEKGASIINAVKNVELSKVNKSKQRVLSMFQTLAETSDLDGGMFVAWMTETGIKNKFVIDKGSIKEENIPTRMKDKERRDNVYIPILHSWVSKMMESRQDWFTHYGLNDVLLNKERDGIYSDGPGTFFISKIGNVISDDKKDSVFGFECGLKAQEKVSTTYMPGTSKRQKEHREFFPKYLSTKERNVPTTSYASTTPKILKVIGLWKIPLDLTKMKTFTTNINGKTAVETNSELIKYAKSHPEENRAGEIMYGDFNRVGLNNEDTSFSINEYVLVQALIMPGTYNPIPIVDMRNIRNKSDTHKQIFSKIGALMYGQTIDPESEAILREFFEDVKNYGDDPEEMKLYIEDLIMRFEELKKKGSFDLSVRALKKYKEKRNFSKTKEPEGKKSEKNKHRFIIHNHYAEKAGQHFDLRLENDKGALSSWAVPKHKLPSGKEKLLAKKVEDHPIEYIKFHGEIPSGEYGGGEVEIFDSGTYEEIEKTPSKIVFKLNGKKEKGIYNLIKTDGDNWLLMKSKLSKE